MFYPQPPPLCELDELDEKYLRFNHNSDEPHEPLNPQKDCNTFIDLNRLPRNCPKIRYIVGDNAVSVPFFIYAPLEALAQSAEGRASQNDFLDRICLDANAVPIKSNGGCKVCHLVNLLINFNNNPEEVKRHLEGKDALTLFNVCLEIWLRLRPKPLVLTERLVQLSRGGQIVSFLFGTDQSDEAAIAKRRENYLKYSEPFKEEIQGMFSEVPTEIQRGVAYDVFGLLHSILQRYVLHYCNLSIHEVHSPTFFLDAMKNRPMRFYLAFARFTLAVAQGLVDVRNGPYDEENRARSMHDIWCGVMNLFAANCAGALDPYQTRPTNAAAATAGQVENLCARIGRANLCR